MVLKVLLLFKVHKAAFSTMTTIKSKHGTVTKNFDGTLSGSIKYSAEIEFFM